jgi:hypothetical protein
MQCSGLRGGGRLYGCVVFLYTDNQATGTPQCVVLAGALMLGTGCSMNWVNGVIIFKKNHQITRSSGTW